VSVASFVPVITNVMTEPDPPVRIAALRALNALHPPPPEAEAALLARMNEFNPAVREAAIECFVARTNPIVIPALEAQLHDPDFYVVTKAITHLKAFGAAATSSVPRLQELLDDPALNVRLAATNALRIIARENSARRAATYGADITFNFPGMPVMQIIEMYERWANKKVAPPPAGWPPAMIRLQTPYPLTADEARQLVEDVLKQEAHIIIHHAADGSLSATLDTSQP
jgi:HEAT repeat protein